MKLSYRVGAFSQYFKGNKKALNVWIENLEQHFSPWKGNTKRKLSEGATFFRKTHFLLSSLRSITEEDFYYLLSLLVLFVGVFGIW